MVGNPPDELLEWFSRCGPNMQCVEVAFDPTHVHVRDSTKPGEKLVFTHDQWRHFVAEVAR